MLAKEDENFSRAFEVVEAGGPDPLHSHVYGVVCAGVALLESACPDRGAETAHVGRDGQLLAVALEALRGEGAPRLETPATRKSEATARRILDNPVINSCSQRKLFIRDALRTVLHTHTVNGSCYYYYYEYYTTIARKPTGKARGTVNCTGMSRAERKP